MQKIQPLSVHTRLLARDFAACFRFYREVMGLEVHMATEGEVYAEFKCGESIIGLFRRDFMAGIVGAGHLPAQAAAQDAVALVLAVKDVDAAAAELQARGAHFVTEPHDQVEWFLRVAHLRDPDGNLIEINTPLSPNEEESDE